MSEEEFKPIRITLSDEAFARLDTIMKDAAFRSYSSTIEECVRVVHDIIGDIWDVAGKRGDPTKQFSDADAAQALAKIITRMDRFTGRTMTR